MHEKNQATAFPGMGPIAFEQVGDFMTGHPFACELVTVADEVLGHDLVAHYRESPSDYSAAAQVAFLVNCLASAHWAEHELVRQPPFVR